MIFLRHVPDIDELKEQLHLTEKQRKSRKQYVAAIQNILSGSDSRKIICIGPCSADNEDAVLEYMLRLAVLQESVSEHFLFIPRVYTSKPRTNGRGYKGLLHRPVSDEVTDNIYEGILATRKMHLHVIQQTGFFCADELLYPEAAYYIMDLLSYTAVGARSVEDQQHRLVASGLDIPVGMKNPTSGEIEVMLNAILAARTPQNLLYHGWECATLGNPYTHGILRGYMENGKMCSNYHYEDLCDIHDAYIKRIHQNISVLVDCSHNNARKHYDEQIRISKEVLRSCKENSDINVFVKGIMIESYLKDGCQMVGEGIYGKSITDPCLGWEKTEILIKELGDLMNS